MRISYLLKFHIMFFTNKNTFIVFSKKNRFGVVYGFPVDDFCFFDKLFVGEVFFLLFHKLIIQQKTPGGIFLSDPGFDDYLEELSSNLFGLGSK